VETHVATVVDTDNTMTAKIAKQYLPGASAYGGIHGRLRAQAAALRATT
jgi:hypothetical protein